MSDDNTFREIDGPKATKDSVVWESEKIGMTTDYLTHRTQQLTALLMEAVIAAGGEVRFSGYSNRREGKAMLHTVDEATNEVVLKVVTYPESKTPMEREEAAMRKAFQTDQKAASL